VQSLECNGSIRKATSYPDEMGLSSIADGGREMQRISSDCVSNLDGGEIPVL
jgi:hypothetical protein